jgi:hypothetical protein
MYVEARRVFENIGPHTHVGWHPASRSRDCQRKHQACYGAVTCQRFFPTHLGSHYIYIRQPSSAHQPDEPPASLGITTCIAQQLDRLQLKSQSDAHTTIQAGEIDDANPWLRRTQWMEYLQGLVPGKLLDSVAAAAEDAEGTEAMVHTIWVAMGEVARISQEITKASSNAIRTEAARIEKDRNTGGKPLQT